MLAWPFVVYLMVQLGYRLNMVELGPLWIQVGGPIAVMGIGAVYGVCYGVGTGTLIALTFGQAEQREKPAVYHSPESTY